MPSLTSSNWLKRRYKMTDQKLPSGKEFTYPIDPKYPNGRLVTLQEAIELGFGGPSIHVHRPPQKPKEGSERRKP